jgi:hypothetical protein
MVVNLKTSNNIIRKKRKLLYDNDTDIVFEYFELIKNKDIERLMNLFSPDAVVYEPFSKLRGGISGRQAIESFLRIVIMANDDLQYRIVIENISDIKNRSNVDSNHNHMNKNSCSSCFRMKVVNVLVTFEKGDLLKARFAFGLSCDNDDDNSDTYINSKYNTIRSLRIQFIK